MDIDGIREAIRAGWVRITNHAHDEARADRLVLDDVFFSTLHGEVIASYPTDRPYPSCLIYGPAQDGRPVHSVWAYNEARPRAILITVYRPDPKRWINWRERKPDS